MKIRWDSNASKPVQRFLKGCGWRVDENAFGREVCFFVIQRGFIRPGGEHISAEQLFAEFRRDPEGLRSKVKRQDILDKGKASMIAKPVVCGQVGWLVLQLLGRRVQNLPMTLLELHILIHILIAAVVYGFWWNKQLDFAEPIILDIQYSDESDELWYRRPPALQRSGLLGLVEKLWLLPPQARPESFVHDQRGFLRIPRPEPRRPAVFPGRSTLSHARKLPTKKLQRILSFPAIFTFGRKRTCAGGASTNNNDEHNSCNATARVTSIPPTPLRTSTVIYPWSVVHPNPREDEGIWEKHREDFIDHASACLFYFLYAGLHAAAWDSKFHYVTFCISYSFSRSVDRVFYRFASPAG